MREKSVCLCAFDVFVGLMYCCLVCFILNVQMCENGLDRSIFQYICTWAQIQAYSLAQLCGVHNIHAHHRQYDHHTHVCMYTKINFKSSSQYMVRSDVRYTFWVAYSETHTEQRARTHKSKRCVHMCAHIGIREKQHKGKRKKWRFDMIPTELGVQSEYNHCRDRM